VHYYRASTIGLWIVTLIGFGCEGGSDSPNVPLSQMTNRRIVIGGTPGEGGEFFAQVFADGCALLLPEAQATLNSEAIGIRQGRSGPPGPYQGPCYNSAAIASPLTITLGQSLALKIWDSSLAITASLSSYHPYAIKLHRWDAARTVAEGSEVTVDFDVIADQPTEATATFYVNGQSKWTVAGRLEPNRAVFVVPGRTGPANSQSQDPGTLSVQVSYLQKTAIASCEHALCELANFTTKSGFVEFPLIVSPQP
jgi:hypothetical protein